MCACVCLWLGFERDCDWIGIEVGSWELWNRDFIIHFFFEFRGACFLFLFSFFCELWIAEAEAVRAYLYSSSYTPSSIPPISILFPLSSTFYIFLSIIYLLCLRFIHCLSPLSSVAFF